MVNKLGIQIALNDPQKGRKWAAGELAGLSESNRGSEIPLSATWEASSPVAFGCGDLGKALGEVSLMPGGDDALPELEDSEVLRL